MNEVYIISRNSMDGVMESNELVMRRNAILREEDKVTWADWIVLDASETERALIVMKLAKESLGPRIHGMVDNVRIEEYIDCRSFNPEDAHNERTWRDLATSLARLHAIDLPFRKPKHNFHDVLCGIHADLKTRLPLLRSILTDERVRKIAEYDFDSLLDWLQPLLDFQHHGIVLSHNDFHFDNLVVLNDPPKYGSSVMIFDFDAASYNMRGRDLGLFLMCRSGFAPSGVREDRAIESNETFFPFLQHYLQEFEKHGTLSINGIDNMDHLMIESLLGGMVSFLIYTFFQLKIMSSEVDDIKTTFTHTVPLMLQAVMECRTALQSRFPEFVASTHQT